VTFVRRTTRWILYLLAFGASLLAAIVLAFAVQARLRLPALSAWHRVVLKNEFVAGRPDTPTTLRDYWRLEDRLFDELRAKILSDPAAADKMPFGRYNLASIPAHLAYETPYNRTYELSSPDPRCAVLLVHGLSDSPYSLRAIAETFHDQGCYVLVLRLPGHGTIPSGLRRVKWTDWYAAVALAAKEVASHSGPGRPFLAGGHSTGAALVALYALRSLEDPALPRPERIYLVSAAIGISRFAVLTNILASLSFIPYFEKSDWMDVLPEFDPYKYNSFPVNAANQIYSLTRVLRSTLLSAAEKGKLGGMPKVTAFQSLVDSTVTAAEVVHGLLGALPRGGNELVLFDLNRQEKLEGFLAPGPMAQMQRLRDATDLPFRLTIGANRPDEAGKLALFSRDPGAGEFSREDLELEWPRGVFSLGHVALPFPPDDPVYGLNPAAGSEFNLGALAPKGEGGALVVPLGMFSRLRCNPFFEVIRRKIKDSLPTGEERAH
jgi:alpha-beta hydrolase superfamily lysophospholipase